MVMACGGACDRDLPYDKTYPEYELNERFVDVFN
jgi:hypothetical protein